MARKKTQPVEKENRERWLLTYADLITLLMIFFVVLYSMSKVDADKFRAVADSLSKALGGGTPSKIQINEQLEGPSIMSTGQQNRPTPPAVATAEDKNKNLGNGDQEKMTIMGVKAKLDKFVHDNALDSKIDSSIQERGLVISIKDTILFASGSAEVTPPARQLLEKLSIVLSAAPNYVKIEGHTDNVPIRTPEFPSNWELSVIRATIVLRILSYAGGIPADRLSATGYGEFRPLAANTTVGGRARNRRVDLVVLRSKYDVVEPTKFN